MRRPFKVCIDDAGITTVNLSLEKHIFNFFCLIDILSLSESLNGLTCKGPFPGTTQTSLPCSSGSKQTDKKKSKLRIYNDIFHFSAILVTFWTISTISVKKGHDAVGVTHKKAKWNPEWGKSSELMSTHCNNLHLSSCHIGLWKGSCLQQH